MSTRFMDVNAYYSNLLVIVIMAEQVNFFYTKCKKIKTLQKRPIIGVTIIFGGQSLLIDDVHVIVIV